MSDTVDTVTIMDNPTKHIIRITNECDGTGESDVVKVDISGLTDLYGNAPKALDLEWCEYQVNGFNYIKIYWAHNTDDEMLVLKGNGFKDFREVGGLRDPRADLTGDATDGDVTLITDGNTDGNSYDITLAFRKRAA